MLDYISWVDASKVAENYEEVLRCEPMGHKLYTDEFGTIRWEPDADRVAEIFEEFGVDDLNGFARTGVHKNTDIYRELYKCIGYSLDGFWEIFYWEINNEDAAEFCIDSATSITCYKCEKSFDDIMEIQEFFQWNHTGGFGSVFGDGTEVEVNLCQDCTLKVLGEYAKYNGE